MLVRGLWLDRLLTAREKSAACDGRSQTGRARLADACSPFEVWESAHSQPLRSSWSGALQPSRRQSLSSLHTTTPSRPDVPTAFTSISKLASTTTIAQCKGALERSSRPLKPLKSMPKNEAVHKEVQSKLDILAGKPAMANISQQRPSQPPCEPSKKTSSKAMTEDTKAFVQMLGGAAHQALSKVISAKGIAVIGGILSLERITDFVMADVEIIDCITKINEISAGDFKALNASMMAEALNQRDVPKEYIDVSTGSERLICKTTQADSSHEQKGLSKTPDLSVSQSQSESSVDSQRSDLYPSMSGSSEVGRTTADRDGRLPADRSQDEGFKDEDTEPSSPLSSLELGEEVIKNVVQAKPNVLGGQASISSRYKQWSTSPPCEAAMGSSNHVNDDEAFSLAEEKAKAQCEAMYKAFTKKRLSVLDTGASRIQMADLSVGDADLLGGTDSGTVGDAEKLDPSTSTLVGKRDKNVVPGKPFTVPIGSVEWPCGKTQAGSASKPNPSDAIEVFVSHGKDVDGHSNENNLTSSETSSCSLEISIADKIELCSEESEQVNIQPGVPLSSLIQDEESIACTPALAPTDHPLPSMSKYKRKRIKVIKAPPIDCVGKAWKELTTRALNVLRSKPDPSALHGFYAPSASPDTINQQPRQKVLAKSDKLEDLDVFALWLFKEALLPPWQNTSFENVVGLGTTSFMSNGPTYDSPIDEAIFESWLKQHPQEKSIGRSYMYNCLLPALEDLESSAERKKWAADLAAYLFKTMNGEDVNLLIRINCSGGSALEPNRDYRLDECVSLAIGFNACLDELCAVPSSDRLDDRMRSLFLQEARAKASSTSLRILLSRTRYDRTELPEMVMDRLNKIKEKVLCRLVKGKDAVGNQPELSEEVPKEEYPLGRILEMDEAIIRSVNSIDENWHHARMAAAAQIGAMEESEEIKEGISEETRQLFADVRSQLKPIKAALAKGSIEGSIYDRQLLELHRNHLASLLRALRLGLSCPEGFQALLVHFMQRMRFASTEVKMIIRIAEKTYKWENWPPFVDFAQHLQGLKALHYYWRNSCLGRDFSSKVEEALWKKLNYTNSLVNTYCVYVHELLKIAREAKEASVTLKAVDGRVLRFDAEGSVRLLKYIEALSLNLKKGSSSTATNDDLRGNSHLQCINLALALLRNGESTENMTLDMKSIDFMQFKKVLKKLHRHDHPGNLMCPDCRSSHSPEMEHRKEHRMERLIVDKTKSSNQRYNKVEREDGTMVEYMTMESKVQIDRVDIERQSKVGETIEQLNARLTNLMKALKDTNGCRKEEDIKYFTKTLLSQVRSVTQGDAGESFLKVVAISIKDSLNYFMTICKESSASSPYIAELDATYPAIISSLDKLLTSASTCESQTNKIYSKRYWSKYKEVVEDCLEFLGDLLKMYYSANLARMYKRLMPPHPITAKDKYIRQIKAKIQDGEIYSKEDDDLRIVEYFQQKKKEAWSKVQQVEGHDQHFTSLELQEFAELKALIDILCKKNEDKERQAILQLSETILPCIEATESHIVGIGSLVDYLTSMQETLLLIEEKATQCGLIEEDLMSIGRLVSKGAQLVEKVLEREDVTCIMAPEGANLMVGLPDGSDCEKVCKGQAKCMVTIVKEAITVFYSSVDSLLLAKIGSATSKMRAGDQSNFMGEILLWVKRIIKLTDGSIAFEWSRIYEEKRQDFRKRYLDLKEALKREVQSKSDDTRESEDPIDTSKCTNKEVKKKKRKGSSKSAGKCRRPLCR
jgi:hypothetical protein